MLRLEEKGREEQHAARGQHICVWQPGAYGRALHTEKQSRSLRVPQGGTRGKVFFGSFARPVCAVLSVSSLGYTYLHGVVL